MSTDRPLPGRRLAGAALAAAGVLLWAAFGGPADVRDAPDVKGDVARPGGETGRLTALLTVRPPDSAEAERALSSLRRGVELMEEGRTGAADDSLSAAGRVIGSASDWIGLGRARIAAVAGDTLRARRLVGDPDSAPSRRWARSIVVTALDSAGDPAGAARAALAWADESDSRAGRGRALLRAGRLLAEAGREERAREALRRSAEAVPWRDPALEAAGELEELGGLSAEQELAAGRALSAHGEWERARERLGAYLSATDGADARRDSIRLEYATALYRADRHLQTVRVAEELREEAPGLAPGALLLEARARVRYGGAADGVELLREVPRRHPDHPAAGEALADLASRAEEEGRADDARDYWVRAAEHAESAETAELRLVRGAALAYMEGRHDSAAALFAGRAGSAASAEARQRSLYWAGLAERGAGREDRSRELLREALDVDRFSYYGTRAAELLGRPLLPADLAPGPWTPGDLERELSNSVLRLRVAKALSMEGAVESEVGRLEEHFRRHEEGRYALSEAMSRGGFPLQGVRVAHGVRAAGDTMNLRLLRALYPFPYREEISRMASRRGLSRYLVAGLIRQESLFEADIESSAGAIGLMQIMPATGRDLARDNDVSGFRPSELDRPSLNLLLGTGYLIELVERFEGNLTYALAAYNAGPHRMSRWRRRPYAEDVDVFMEEIPFRQTRHYVKAVHAHARIYAALYSCGRYEPCLGRVAAVDFGREAGAPSSSSTR